MQRKRSFTHGEVYATISCCFGECVLSAWATSYVNQTSKDRRFWHEYDITPLSCQEYSAAQRFRMRQTGEKGMTAGNVARAILFWPAFVAAFRTRTSDFSGGLPPQGSFGRNS